MVLSVPMGKKGSVGLGWVLAAVMAMSALTGCSRKKEIWIYTSIYKEWTPR